MTSFLGVLLLQFEPYTAGVGKTTLIQSLVKHYAKRVDSGRAEVQHNSSQVAPLLRVATEAAIDTDGWASQRLKLTEIWGGLCYCFVVLLALYKKNIYQT